MNSLANSLQGNDQHPDWLFPLILSCMAGASTCVGAAVVFCFTPETIKKSMSFSLSLAASVMITVSVISIGPECWHGIIITESTTGVDHPGMPPSRTIIHWWLLLERLVSFGLGCGGYVLLSKLLATIPDPEHLFVLSAAAGKNNTQDKEKQQVLTFDDSGAMSYEEIKDSEPTAKRERRLSIDSSMSGDSFDSFYTDDPLLEDDIEMTTATSTQEISPSKDHQNHPMRRKLTTQSTTENDNHAARGFDKNEQHLTEALIPYDKDATAKQRQKQRSWRVAMLLFFSLLAHNFPEGLCVVSTE